MSKTVVPLMTAIEANVPVIVVGEPGTAKTAMIEQVIGPKLNMHVETTIVSIRDITDISGLPVVRDDGVFMAPASFVRRIKEAYERTGRPVIHFWDEISTAPPACQAGALRCINENRYGDEHLPYVRHVAAMNPSHTSAGGGELTAPLANRFCHLPWAVDTGMWVEWAMLRSQSHVTIGGYIRNKPQALLNVPKDESKLGSPWPSPRTWDMAGRLMESNVLMGGSRDNEIMLVSGCIGEGHSIEFLNWRNTLDLPDPEMLLKNPEKFKVPDRGDVTFTILGSVTHAVLNKLTKERYLSAWQVFHIAATHGKKDIAAGSVSQLIKGVSGQGWLADVSLEKELKPLLAPFVDILVTAGKINKK